MNKYMNLAVEHAKIAFHNSNVPVGAVIVKNNEIIAACHNKKNTDNVAIYHAEILCIIEACKKIGSWYLNDCDIYVTLRPCNMCLYALAEARISNVYYLLDSDYDKNLNSNFNNINISSIDDIYEYSSLIKDFFKNLRDKNDVSRETQQFLFLLSIVYNI